MKIKGVSPLIASILLIAFTVAVGGIISIWITGFTTTQTEIVKEKSSSSLICSYGGISFVKTDLKYDCNTGRLAGSVENTQSITLGNISIQIIFRNSSSAKYNLWEAIANTTELKPRERGSFNFSTASSYDKLIVITNCSSVYDEAESGDVTTNNC